MTDNADTPDERALIVARRRAERERLLRELERLPDYGDDEPSVVTIRAEGDAAEKLLARIRKDSPVPPSGPESIRVRAGKLLERRFGKAIASIIMTVLGLLFAALVQAIFE